ncbi:hypothetical protein VTK26DRAFT_4137 [Humicola hyalothermophila]
MTADPEAVEAPPTLETPEDEDKGVRKVEERMSSDSGGLGDGEDTDSRTRHGAEHAGDRNTDGSGMLGKVVSRVLTRASTKSSWNPGPPPDGGLKAWTAVICAHLVVMDTWGIINSFGLFQTYYTEALGRAPSDISWIGSVQIFLIFFIGALTGRLTDAGYFRHLFVVGAAFQAVGIFTASVATRYWQVLLAQGICMGLGNGCMFCPCIATVSTYFSRKRSLAIGIVACGSATGGLVFPSMVRQLAPARGFPSAMRAIGYVQVATLAVVFVFLKPRLKPRKSGPLVEWGAFKEAEYSLYAAATFSMFIGLYFAFYYIASFSRDIIGLSYTDSLNLLLVINGAGCPGRLIPNSLADRFGAINIFVPTAAIAGVCLFCWMAVTSTAGLYVWCVSYGMVAGGVQSLFPAALSSLTTDLRKAGVRIGMVFTIVSFATLAGPPISGAIITGSGGEYYGAQGFAGAALLLGTAFMAAAKVVKGRKMVAEDKAGSALWAKV